MAQHRIRPTLDAVVGPWHPTAVSTLLAAVEQAAADPGALHSGGRQARQHLDLARALLAQGLGVAPDELSLHASPEAAMSAALDGLAAGRRRLAGEPVVSAVEHSTVLRWARHHHPGHHVAPVDRYGAVDLERLGPLIDERTPFVALQQANGEVGTLQPLAEARQLSAAHGVPLLVDARACLGRIATPVEADVLVGSASSWGGPPIGVLAVRTGTRFAPTGPQSPHERGLAQAPPFVPLALAAAEAWQQVAATRDQESVAAHALVDQVRAAAATVDDVDVVGHPVDRLPHVVTFSVLYVDGETIVHACDRAGFAVASGSACTSDTLEPSHVLAAMGALTHGNVRITLPLGAAAPDREETVAALCEALPAVIASCRGHLDGLR